MAFPELPDDRRARPRRYRGGADDGDPGIPDDRSADRRGGRSGDERSAPSRHRAAADDAPPAREPGGRRRLRTEDDEPRPNGNGSHGPGDGRPPADRLRDAYPYAGDGPDGARPDRSDRDPGRPAAATSATPYSDARRAAALRGEDPYPADLLPDAGSREKFAHPVNDFRDSDGADPRDPSPRDDRRRDPAPRDDRPRDAAPRDDRPRDPAPRDDLPRDPAPRDDLRRRSAPPDAPDRSGGPGRRAARHQGRPDDVPGDPDGPSARGGRPSWDEPGGFPDDAGRRPPGGPGTLAPPPGRNGAPGRNGDGRGPNGAPPGVDGRGPGGGPAGGGPGPYGPGRNGTGPGPDRGGPGRNGAPGRTGSDGAPYGPNGGPNGFGPASGPNGGGPNGAPFGPNGGPNGGGPNGAGPNGAGRNGAGPTGAGPNGAALNGGGLNGGAPDGGAPNGAPAGRRRRLDQDEPAGFGRPGDDAAPSMPPPPGPRGRPPAGPSGPAGAPELRQAPPGARRPVPPRPGGPGPAPYEDEPRDDYADADAYEEYDDLPDDEDAVETPTRAVGRPRTRAEPGDPASETTTARARAPGRRTGREDPEDEWSDEDRFDDEDDRDDDDPRVGKRAGPVGIGGRLSALTSRRNDDGTKKPTSFWKELPLLIGVALVLTFLIQTFVAKVFVIPSGSMETTLHGCTGCTNDRVLVDKVTYNFTAIAPGDVVVFRGPPAWANSEYEGEQTSNPILRGLQTAGSLIGFAPPDENDFVKRVIAVGGQTVACCDALNQVMVDGQPLSEPYIYYLPQAGPARQIPFGPIKVPDGELWVMGDSRNNSADARAHGPVPADNVIGKVRLIVLPFTRFGWVDAVNPQTTASVAAGAGLPQGTALALGMMGAFPFALGRRRSLRHRAEEERFLPVARRRERWRRSS